MTQLTGFRRDLLAAIVLTDENHGLGIKNWMESNMDYDTVHHGRLYPNIDKLVNMGLVRKERLDARTNVYELTPRGHREVEYYADLWERVEES